MEAGPTSSAWLARLINVVMCAVALGLGLPVWAGPPRVLDENEVQPTAFSQLDDDDMPRQLTPRNSPRDSPPNAGAPSKKTGQSVSLWGTVAGLFVVFALFLSARVWLVRHGPIGMRGLPIEAWELLGRRVIEPRVSIHIVRCGPKILVLGIGPDGVRTLAEITDPVEIDLMAGACRRKEAASPASSFAGMLNGTGVSGKTSRAGGAS